MLYVSIFDNQLHMMEMGPQLSEILERSYNCCIIYQNKNASINTITTTTVGHRCCRHSIRYRQ